VKPLWKVSIPHYDLYRYIRASSARAAVFAALKRLEKDRPSLKGGIYYARWTGEAEEYAKLQPSRVRERVLK